MRSHPAHDSRRSQPQLQVGMAKPLRAAVRRDQATNIKCLADEYSRLCAPAARRNWQSSTQSLPRCPTETTMEHNPNPLRIPFDTYQGYTPYLECPCEPIYPDIPFHPIFADGSFHYRLGFEVGDNRYFFVLPASAERVQRQRDCCVERRGGGGTAAWPTGAGRDHDGGDQGRLRSLL